jgi:hypothetical protein
MPTLRELQNEGFRRTFSSGVARDSMLVQEKVVELNHGFKTEQELVARIREGRSVDFDYNRLMHEASQYA